MIWVVLVAFLAFLIWHTSIRSFNYYSNLGVKQTKPWPILGDQWPLLLKTKSFGEFVLWIYNMHKKCRYIGHYQFNVPLLMLRDPELIKQITVKDFDHFTDHRPFVGPESDPIWSGNLFALTGQKWKDMRTTLSGSFSSSKMKHMFETINEAAENFVQYFIDKNKDFYELEVKDSFTRYTNDVIATAAFGIKVDSLGEPDNQFYNMGKLIGNFTGFFTGIKLLTFFMLPRISKLLNLNIFKKELIDYFRSIIHEAIHTREEKGIVRNDMINLLLETRKGVTHEEEGVSETGYATLQEFTYLDKPKFKQAKWLTDDDITSQALLFFLAGFETTSTALCFGTYELALGIAIQDKLREEILETHRENNGKLTYDSLLKMNYMDKVFSENLRKWPPVVMIDRLCIKPYTILPKYPDEKPLPLKIGDFVMLPLFGLHRDPKYFPNPENFDPERFSEENKDKIIPYSYIPFGSGPRNCIASRFAILEAKAVLYYLLLNFRIVPVKQTAIPLKLSKDTLKHTAEGGFWLGLERIRQQ